MERTLYGEGTRHSEEQQKETAEDPEGKTGGKKGQKRAPVIDSNPFIY
jgi:hypothetical protein